MNRIDEIYPYGGNFPYLDSNNLAGLSKRRFPRTFGKLEADRAKPAPLGPQRGWKVMVNGVWNPAG